MKRAMRSPFFVYWRFPRDHPADRAHDPSVPRPPARRKRGVAQLGERAVGVPERAPRARGAVIAHIEASISFSKARRWTCRTRARDRHPRPSQRRRRRRPRPARPRRTGWRCRRRAPAALHRAVHHFFEHQAEPWRGVPAVEAPALTRLHGPLVEHDGVHPSAEVVEVGEGALRLALGHDALDQGLADVAHRCEPEDDARPGSPRRPPRRAARAG